ncbi:hypothetical protein ANCCEY_03256 [Ancylostoma ceylanicum]|uniref:Uncharacterized protein n=1 Tax=Ancylostoma ceylanicum TaxID=53326 RepID=A0A0D6M045_9BILA|nr:hypothetical protein ANCCEY_03256 [Ancylostoma ceylanicum]
MASTVCKPLWEDGELGLGLRRKEAGPWQTRKQFGDRLIKGKAKSVRKEGLHSSPDQGARTLVTMIEAMLPTGVMVQARNTTGSSSPISTTPHGRISLDADRTGGSQKLS